MLATLDKLGAFCQTWFIN